MTDIAVLPHHQRSRLPSDRLWSSHGPRCIPEHVGYGVAASAGSEGSGYEKFGRAAQDNVGYGYHW